MKGDLLEHKKKNGVTAKKTVAAKTPPKDDIKTETGAVNKPGDTGGGDAMSSLLAAVRNKGALKNSAESNPNSTKTGTEDDLDADADADSSDILSLVNRFLQESGEKYSGVETARDSATAQASLLAEHLGEDGENDKAIKLLTTLVKFEEAITAGLRKFGEEKERRERRERIAARERDSKSERKTPHTPGKKLSPHRRRSPLRPRKDRKSLSPKTGADATPRTNSGGNGKKAVVYKSSMNKGGGTPRSQFRIRQRK